MIPELDIAFEPISSELPQKLIPIAGYWAIIDGEMRLLFKRRHKMVGKRASGTLLLQHYGCPTSGVDITSDVDVALAFAAGGITVSPTGEYTRISTPSRVDRPIIYIMLLRNIRDPFLNSRQMFE